MVLLQLEIVFILYPHICTISIGTDPILVSVVITVSNFDLFSFITNSSVGCQNNLFKYYKKLCG